MKTAKKDFRMKQILYTKIVVAINHYKSIYPNDNFKLKNIILIFIMNANTNRSIDVIASDLNNYNSDYQTYLNHNHELNNFNNNALICSIDNIEISSFTIFGFIHGLKVNKILTNNIINFDDIYKLNNIITDNGLNDKTEIIDVWATMIDKRRNEGFKFTNYPYKYFCDLLRNYTNIADTDKEAYRYLLKYPINITVSTEIVLRIQKSALADNEKNVYYIEISDHMHDIEKTRVFIDYDFQIISKLPYLITYVLTQDNSKTQNISKADNLFNSIIQEDIKTAIRFTPSINEDKHLNSLIANNQICQDKITKSIDTKKRQDYISWNQYFMGIAELSAKRSKDPNTQVGCCIVNNSNIIMSIGYNGFPRGCSDDDFSWGKIDKNDNKYLYVAHAELNAILNYRGESLNDCILYVTLYPCNECAKAIIQSGIKKVIYKEHKHPNSIQSNASAKMFNSAGIIVEKYIDE